MFRFATAAAMLLAATPQAQESTVQTSPTIPFRIVAIVPEETTGTVYLAGNAPQLGPWNPALLAMEGSGAERAATLALPEGFALEFKLTLGSWATVEEGTFTDPMANHRVVVTAAAPEHRVKIPRFRRGHDAFLESLGQGELKGRAEILRDVTPKDPSLKPRHVIVWLPTEYDANPGRRFPVLYMHDGQNLFDPRLCMTGVDWGVDEAVERLAARGAIVPPIVVGVFHSDDRREDYCGWQKGDSYARFLAEELKPRIDAAYRTMPESKHSAVMGSSMGGLISLWIAWKWSHTFGVAGCVSTHYTYENGRIVSMIRDSGSFPAEARVYFDYGTETIDAPYEPFQTNMTMVLKSLGRVEGRDFIVRKYQGADHSERAWRERMDHILLDLFGAEGIAKEFGR